MEMLNNNVFVSGVYKFNTRNTQIGASALNQLVSNPSGGR